MLNGAELYAELDKRFTRYDGRNDHSRPIVFETFPHAIACSLAGKTVRARNKRVARRDLLNKFDVSCDELTNIDFVDAALCALTADFFARRQYKKYGDSVEGYIVVPATELDRA